MEQALERRNYVTRSWLLARSAELRERVRNIESDLRSVREPLPSDSSEAAIAVENDEVLKDMWKDSPEVKDLMARENLKDEHEVQSYFIRRIEKFINSKGKKIIGWDEILEGPLTNEGISADAAVRQAVESQGVVGMDFVREVTAAAPYQWDPTDQSSAAWAATGSKATRLPPIQHRIVAYDYGIKENIPLELENSSPEIVSMTGGNTQRITIHPSEVQAGAYTTDRILTGVEPGAFSIVGTVR